MLGDWRGKTLINELAWVASDGSHAVCARASGGGVIDDSALEWVTVDLTTGEAHAHGRAAISHDTVLEMLFDDDGRGICLLDAGERTLRVNLARAVVTPTFAPADWGMKRARIEAIQASFPTLHLLGMDAQERWLLASQADSHALTLIDRHTDEQRSWSSGHAAGIVSLAFSGDGALLASSAYDEDLRVWDLGLDECAWTFEPDPRGELRVRFEGDGRTLSAWGTEVYDQSQWMMSWSLEGGEARGSASLPVEGDGGDEAMSPDGGLLARLTPSGREVVLLRFDTAPISSQRLTIPFAMRAVGIAFTEAGRALRLVGVDGARWCVGDLDLDASRAATKRAVALGELRQTEVPQALGAAFVLEGGQRALLTAPGHMRWCELDSGAAGASLRRGIERGLWAWQVALHPMKLALFEGDRVEVWTSQGALDLDLDLAPLHDSVSAIAFDPAGEQLAIGTALGVVLVYRRG